MRILAIASASGGCAAALVLGNEILAYARSAEERGLADRIPALLAGLLAKAGPAEAIAVIIGPGSFTGLRAGIAAGTGIALGAGIPIVGVSVAEALAETLPALEGRTLWVAAAARRGHVFLDIDGTCRVIALDALPTPFAPLAVAGDAANPVAAALAAKGSDVMLTAARRPTPVHVAAVALRRLRGAIPGLAPLPLYTEAPLVTRAAIAARPAPLA